MNFRHQASWCSQQIAVPQNEIISKSWQVLTYHSKRFNFLLTKSNFININSTKFTRLGARCSIFTFKILSFESRCDAAPSAQFRADGASSTSHPFFYLNENMNCRKGKSECCNKSFCLIFSTWNGWWGAKNSPSTSTSLREGEFRESDPTWKGG